MPTGGKDAFLSKVTFRRESNWYSKTKQMLKDMKTIEERAKEFASKYLNPKMYEEAKKLYIKIATGQQKIDIDKACEWLMEHIGGNVECNDNGEPLAESFIEERKLAMQIVNDFRKAMEE